MILLRIDSSARADSVTRRLMAKFAEEWKTNHPTGEFAYRDLSTTTLPLITDDWGATQIDSSKLSPSQRSYLSTLDALIAEVLAADIIVIGALMYNFAIPSLLKSWIAQVVRIGKTVAYVAPGPQGLLGNKKVVVITACGWHMKRAARERTSIFKNPICATYLDFLVSRI